jgi:hypothetical protein
MNTQGIPLELLEPSAGTHKVAHLFRRDFPFSSLSIFLEYNLPAAWDGRFVPVLPTQRFTHASMSSEGKGVLSKAWTGALEGMDFCFSPLLSEGMQERMVKGKTEEEGGGRRGRRGGGGREGKRKELWCNLLFCVLSETSGQTKKSREPTG